MPNMSNRMVEHATRNLIEEYSTKGFINNYKQMYHLKRVVRNKATLSKLVVIEKNPLRRRHQIVQDERAPSPGSQGVAHLGSNALVAYNRVASGIRRHPGHAATHGELAVSKNDPAAQAHFVIDKIEASLESLGAKLSDVVRTRVFVNNMTDYIKE